MGRVRDARDPERARELPSHRISTTTAARRIYYAWSYKNICASLCASQDESAMRKAAGMARKVQEVAAVRDAVVRDAAVDGDRVMGALCAVAGVCANEVLGMRA